MCVTTQTKSRRRASEADTRRLPFETDRAHTQLLGRVHAELHRWHQCRLTTSCQRVCWLSADSTTDSARVCVCASINSGLINYNVCLLYRKTNSFHTTTHVWNNVWLMHSRNVSIVIIIIIITCCSHTHTWRRRVCVCERPRTRLSLVRHGRIVQWCQQECRRRTEEEVWKRRLLLFLTRYHLLAQEAGPVWLSPTGNAALSLSASCPEDDVNNVKMWLKIWLIWQHTVTRWWYGVPAWQHLFQPVTFDLTFFYFMSSSIISSLAC